jgi:acylphosphatase
VSEAAGVKRLSATITGRVQGVGFREFVRSEASSRGLCGYVRNSDDGSAVELVAEGEERELASLMDALRRGPRFATVDEVQAEYSEASRGFSRFSVEM